MKSVLLDVLGFGDPRNYVTGLILFLLGLLIVCDGQIGIQATPTSEVRWLTVFAELDNWIGWLFVWFGIDSFLNFKLTTLIVEKVLSPIFSPVIKAIVGEERIKRLQERMKKGEGGEDHA